MIEIQLSDEQSRALDMMVNIKKEGGFGLIVGKAGTGKSESSRVFQKRFPRTIFSAPTGVASININGVTLDSLCGWRPNETKPKRFRSETRDAILNSGVIVIDEISMVRCDKLDRLNRQLQSEFGNMEPFGGIGVIGIGDPFQLPPFLGKAGEPDREYFEKLRYETPMFFGADCLNPKRGKEMQFVELTKIFRQTEDDGFKDALNFIREGNSKGIKLINSCYGKFPGANAIKLVFKNEDALTENQAAFAFTSGESKTYYGECVGEVLTDELPAPSELALKVGSRVIAIANGRVDPQTREREPYMNGDLGTVAELRSGSVVVEFDRGFRFEMTDYTWGMNLPEVDEQGDLFVPQVPEDLQLKYRQIPLKLGHAISTHKSQGMTLESVHLCAKSDAFAPGQMYVALSRCKKLSTLSISRHITVRDIMVNRDTLEWYRSMQERSLATN